MENSMTLWQSELLKEYLLEFLQSGNVLLRKPQL